MRELLELSVEFRSCNNSANSDLQIRISIQTNVLAFLVHPGFNSNLIYSYHVTQASGNRFNVIAQCPQTLFLVLCFIWV